ncbi:MAG: tRNA (guanosine(37)-N1)-methyltransferase TrmD [Candidatus Wildermuthbacteria bacterium RIFCSPHIGHO2_02_FULL_49_9]|uniref:tRNA (guanine-N(1)-)-methyltransferase n=2 Tax=Candidatus Wildermuthiibacteriota TaxID=1817923 RepID=A0A1G2QW87_9BACT|nr:MAG: tRNA (guanosine(37)-N1)-methyltransferase TrmD [Candidatus Wildermuthbacteria bacterium RIFCSPHIGHO2_01_FULL_49_22b]OHA71104.1 MAG: tRNA (guanosine(37)-N1)-methyltransferase TrmD [Candidatus Wildermuthbacteria bacterium RIFCSPHIGHO2_02_FULL_49_9]
MLTFDVLTIFPELFEPFAKESLLFKASKKKLLKIQAHDLRQWAKDRHRTVDDKPFGGGLGMVMRVEPVYKAVSTLKSKIQNPKSKTKVILFTPRGKKFDQKMAYKLSRMNHIIMVCGRYEGVDERIAKKITDVELSVGDYVLMGGEVPAMAVIEAISRLIPGVVGKPQFLKERLGKGRKKGFLEYPQYTRPEIFEPKRGVKWRVPKVLLSGNHKDIEEWKAKHGRVIA